MSEWGGDSSVCMSGVYHATVFFSGRVQLEAEGRPPDVKAFIAAVRERMEGHIRKVEEAAATRPPQFTGFTIR